ncbi:MAG: hypothetical protein FJX35_07150 [Alphaproteobacteria bacterium]|nr:hypothetical protein [Alphaproteobacteria bacterium]
MSAVADAMIDMSDAEPQQGSVPSAIAKAARFLVDLKSGKVSAKSEDIIGAANAAGPARRDSVTSGRPTADRIAAAHAAAQRALGIVGAGKPEEQRQEPRLTPAKAIAENHAASQAAAPQAAAPKIQPRSDTPAATPAPKQARPAAPARQARPSEPARARPAAPVAAQMPPPSTAASRPPLSVKQYLRELQFQVTGHNQNEVRQALVEVTPGEVERVTRVVARLRGRYLAQVLELGQAVHKPVPETETKQLRNMREMYEEAARGLDYLKDAIDKGEVGLNGVFM